MVSTLEFIFARKKLIRNIHTIITNEEFRLVFSDRKEILETVYLGKKLHTNFTRK